MIRPEVVQYLRENLAQHPIENLRRQLSMDGISDIDFEHCLAFVLRESQAATTAPPKAPLKKKTSKPVHLALLGGLALFVGLGLFALSRKSSAPSSPMATKTISPPHFAESGFVGSAGWVVHLPKDYVAFSEFKDSSKTEENIHFAKSDTDPTNFLDKGLYGQMGIVQLDVVPNPFPMTPVGTAGLANAVQKKMASNGERYSMKPIQIGTLSGVQVNIQAHFPRVEAYVLGRNQLYFFYGGQEDDVWRDIVLSLRDVRSEE